MEDNNKDKEKTKWTDIPVDDLVENFIMGYYNSYKNEKNSNLKKLKFIKFILSVLLIMVSISLFDYIFYLYELITTDNLVFLDVIEVFFLQFFVMYVGAIAFMPLIFILLFSYYTYRLWQNNQNNVNFTIYFFNFSKRFISFTILSYIVSCVVSNFVMVTFAYTPIRYEIYNAIGRDTFFLSGNYIPNPVIFIDTPFSQYVKFLFQ